MEQKCATFAPWPKFCSMKISQDIRAEAQAGMKDKAREFRDAGGELYVPEIPSA